MAGRVRVWHPDHPPTYIERVLDCFVGTVPEALPDDVDTSLLVAQQLRTVRTFLDGCFSVVLLGHEMVRADSSFRLPESPQARQAAGEALALRLRFGQVHPTGVRVPLAARWFELNDVSHGTRCLIRLVELPQPHLRSFLAVNLGNDPLGPWTEVAVGDR
ncbi:MAG: hypothetical protein FJ102_26045 [Deltaproteobacteria bacterium]|nr:hypothetical protein [Deltaproteobacteria bacterium]